MKVIELKNGRLINSEEVDEIIINGQRKEFDNTKHFDVAKVLHEGIKTLSCIKVILKDGTTINTGDVASFILF